jgi:hypothetical protein
MDFIAQHEAEDFANAGDCLEQIQGAGIVVLGGFEERTFEVLELEQFVIIREEGQGLVDGWSGAAFRNAITVCFRGDLFADFRRVRLAFSCMEEQ